MVPTLSKPLVAGGRYEILDLIATGGMAAVHFALRQEDDGSVRVVAVKKLHPNFTRETEFVSMLLDEARIVSNLHHPNVVALHEVVQDRTEVFLALQYIHGERLSALMRNEDGSRRSLPPPIAARIVVDCLHGLHAAHEAKDERGRPLNIVHRDVSPQNVLVGTDGIAKVFDFGIAMAEGRLQATREGCLKGKLSYMPPEQLGGGPVTRRADIYATAVMLWEALTGRSLFGGEGAARVAMNVMRGTARAPGTLVKGIPAQLDSVVMQGLARDPEQRYLDARRMAVALSRAVEAASPSEVAAWVSKHGGEPLRARTVRLAALEAEAKSRSHPSMSVRRLSVRTPMSVILPRDTDLDTTIAYSSILQVRRSRARVTLIAAGIGVGFLMSLFLGNGLSRRVRAAERTTVASPVLDEPPAQAVPSPPAPKSLQESTDLLVQGDVAEAASSAPPVLELDVAPAAEAPKPIAPKADAHPASKAPRGAATAPAHPADHCVPPYAITPTGKKKFKLECL